MKTTKLRSILQRAQGGLLGAALLLAWPLLLAESASAQTEFRPKTWIASGVGNWFVDTNWFNGLPDATRPSRINNGGTAQILDLGGSAGYNGARSGDMDLGEGPLDSGTLEIFGSGTAEIEGIAVGRSGQGTLNIANGGRVSVINSFGFLKFANIGVSSGSTGTATVDGPGSLWTNANDLTVGGSGHGVLGITGGGRTSNQNGNIGLAPGANGMVVVDGSDSLWFNHSVVAVGVSGTAALSITGGGQVTSFHGRIGREVGSTGTVVIDGPGSAWNIREQLTIGLSDRGTGTLSVQNGGLVYAAVVTVGPNATVRGDGTILANVTNTGTVAPRASPGALQVTGNYWQFIGGKLQIELASPTSFGKLAVTGNVTLEPEFGFGLGSGPLEVALAGGYVPHGSQSFDILDWTGSLSGTFSSIQLPTLGGTLVWDTSQIYTTGVLSVVGPPAPVEADFDEDGDVDGNDVVRWRTNFGTGSTHMQGDADGDQDVDGADFLTWQQQLGSASTVTLAGQVPEPATFTLFSMTCCGLARLRPWRSEKRRNADRPSS